MDFDWRTIGDSGRLVRLFYQSREVARLCARLDGTWYVALNQHLPYTDPERRDVGVRSYDAGKTQLEAWLVREEGRIKEEMRSWLAAREPDRA